MEEGRIGKEMLDRLRGSWEWVEMIDGMSGLGTDRIRSNNSVIHDYLIRGPASQIE